ncbi:MAG: flagellar filament capping protein FliD [Myxococcota bacterium]
MASTFNVGGIASGLDTNSIIDQLVKIESSSVTAAQSRQAAYKSQISQLGTLVSKLQALGSAASALNVSGALGLSQVGTATGFSATPSSSATAGRYDVLVEDLATAAKAKSAQFSSATDAVKAGTLDLSINGTTTSVTITDGMTLGQVAKAINDSGAAVSATVLESNGKAFLSLTNKNTGFTVGQPAASALTITEIYGGTTGTELGLAITQPATNAKVTIDGLSFERTANVIDDALPGVTLSLKAKTTSSEVLELANDTAATATNLQKFVTAYNDVMKVLRENLNIGQSTDRTKTLGGDSAIRQLQSSMMNVVSSVANPGSTVRSLADLGIKTQGDGTLALDQARLSKAIAADPAAVNELFQTASTGVSAQFKALTDGYTNASSGILVSKSKSYEQSVKQLDKQIDGLQLRLEAYRNKLVAQFTAMEKVVSNFKSLGNYLTSQENKSNNSNNG